MNFYNPYQQQMYQPMGQLEQLRQPYQQPQPQQSFQMQQTPQMQQGSGIIWVNSEMEARNYMMAPNAAVTLWDVNSPVLYLKKTDASGRPEFETYDLVKRTAAPQQPNIPAGDFITRKEFEDTLRALFPAKGKFEKGEVENESIL